MNNQLFYYSLIDQNKELIKSFGTLDELMKEQYKSMRGSFYKVSFPKYKYERIEEFNNFSNESVKLGFNL